jgi:oligopeptide transport system substrate-binding protein
LFALDFLGGGLQYVRPMPRNEIFRLEFSRIWLAPPILFRRRKDMIRRIWLAVSLLVVTGLMLTACQTQTVEKPVVQTVIVTAPPQTEIKEVVATDAPKPVAKVKVLHLNLTAGEVATIDPALATDVDAIQLVDEMTVGVVRQNETTGNVEKALATSWDISPDGLVYTFHLRTGVPWVKYDAKTRQVVKVKDGEGKDRTVTAQDFEYGILRTLDPKTASDYAYVLTYVISGAAQYNSGALTDTTKVGVKAIDDATLQITFMDPVVYNLNIAGMWVAHAQPSWLIEEKKDRWTETGNQQSYGPFTLKEWYHDASLTLVKNPFWPSDIINIPQSKIDELTFTMLDASSAFAEFEAGNLDVSGIPLSDVDRVKVDPKLSKQIENVPAMGTEFYAFNVKKAPLDDVRVRRALSYAIDRQSLIDNIIKGQGEPAPWFCRPGAAGCPTLNTYPNLGIKYDAGKAKSELEAYLKEKNLTADQLDLMLTYNTTEANKKTAEAIVAMWKQVLGLNVTMTNMERKVFYAQRQSDPNMQIMRSSWVQDYQDANNFDREVFSTGGAYANITRWSDSKYDEMCTKAAKEQDPTKRMELYSQIDQYLVVDQAVIAPLYWYSSLVIYQPHVKHTKSVTGYDWFEKWDIAK